MARRATDYDGSGEWFSLHSFGSVLVTVLTVSVGEVLTTYERFCVPDGARRRLYTIR